MSRDIVTDALDELREIRAELNEVRAALVGFPSVSLRDQFAMAALSGTCNAAVNMADVEGAILATALRCYDYADAMIKARKNGCK